MRRAIMVALVSALSCAGCAIRYDATGVSRVGIGLWGFGDPPGVNWNLDWPRRDVPELPASTRPELPPRRGAPQWQGDMSPPGRPKGEYRSAQREGDPITPPGRPKGEYRSAKREGGAPLAYPDACCGLEFPIGDNRDCASRCLLEMAAPMAVRARDRHIVAAR